MGRGSKEGSGQKTRGERQQLQKKERHIHRVTAEMGLGAESHPSQIPYSGLDSSESNGEEHQLLPYPFQDPPHPTSPSQPAPQYLAAPILLPSQPTFPGFGSKSDKGLWSTFL